MVHLLFPSHDKHLAVERKLQLDGTFVDEKAKIWVPLSGKMATVADNAEIPTDQVRVLKKGPKGWEVRGYDPLKLFLENIQWMPGGKTAAEIWIDAERGLQVKYTGVGFVGPDGRMMYASLVKKHSTDLQTRGFDFTKYTWPLVIFVLGIMAALVAALAFTVQK